MRPLPAGVPGELYVAGPGLARGYFNSPDLEKEKFVTPEGCPFGEERFYRTGDLVRRGPGGDLVFIGRVDDQVKIRGFRIELGDIESSLDEHPGIARSVVAVKEEGSSTRQLWAFYRTDHDKPLEEGELREFLAARLPAYMIPSRFIHVKEFPLTAHGKIDRKRLLREAGSSEDKKLPVSPRTETEKRLSLVWEKLLGITAPGVRSNFFSLGGHSLLAARLFSEIEREFGQKLPLSMIFREGTIEALSLALDEREDPWPFECLVPLRTEGQGTPLFLLHAVKGEVYAYMDLVERLPKGYPVYAFQPPGFARGDKLPMGIEWMVETYLEELERFRPEGPYLLAGHSFGGLVAYEMAVRLAGKGKEVPYLAVFDTTLEFETLPFLLTKGGFLPEQYRRKRIARQITSIPDRIFEYLKFHARYL
ncbi:MAG TPA: alpha/beta fold hydrolase, partial [Synergistales bacterium]|nr:alpha/beta fold hydrolase [Synergistales bacterium]